MSANSIASIKAANVIAKPTATQSTRGKTAEKTASADAGAAKTKSASHSVSISDAGKAALQDAMNTDSSASAKG